jgi:predicted Rossmann fold nucleotide-binding protein DprA/Smf involved in DNA uptake
MMNEKKMTKRDYFNSLLAIEEVKANDNLVNFINHELDLLARKNASGEGKMTANQKANEELKSKILECMEAEPNRLFTITEMIKEFECCADLTLPKVSALVKQLKAEGKVVRTEEKRKAYFRIA